MERHDPAPVRCSRLLGLAAAILPFGMLLQDIHVVLLFARIAAPHRMPLIYRRLPGASGRADRKGPFLATTAYLDSDLERSIRMIIATSDGLDYRNYAVVAINGRVRLCGEARSYAEKRQAGAIAASVPGVREVINQLRVTPG